jgi:preprotein translocase subunit YajC
VQDYAWLLWLVAIVAVFWLLIIRPQKQRQKAMAQLQSELGVGEQVMLTSGIYATVVAIADDHAVVEVSPGTTLKVARGAIGAVIREEAGEPAPESDDRDDSDNSAEPNDGEER